MSGALAGAGLAAVRPAAATATAGATPDDHHGVHDLEGLRDLLDRSLQLADAAAGHDPGEVRDRLIDAFLCACGMSQVLSDRLHRDPAELGKVAKYASRIGGPAGRAAGRSLHIAAGGLRSGRVGLLEREQVRWLAACEELSGHLGSALWGAEGAPSWPDPGSTLRRSALGPARPGRWAAAVAVPPRSFSTFDQRPEDCARLAADFAARYPDRERALLVVGVRTSGCFLAPVQATALRVLGYRTVRFLSWRPGQAVLPADAAAVRWAARADALVLVTDDPPTSGGSFARVAENLVRMGVAAANVVLLLQVFGSPGKDRWSRRLEGWNSVVLGWERWHVHRLLEPDAIRDALEGLLPGRQITVWRSGVARRIVVAEVTFVSRPVLSPARRDHVQGRVEVGLRAATGELLEHTVGVKGVGLGYYGRRASSIAARLGDAIPEVYGIRDGLQYRAWIPAELALDGDRKDGGELAPGIAAYVAARAAALPVARDLAAAASGHDALWEQCARWLALPFGRAGLPLRPFLHEAGRRLLAVEHPSLIDGDMGPGRWFRSTTGPSPGLLKVEWDERPFVYQIPFHYDPGYDLAVASAERPNDAGFEDELRRQFAKAGGGQIENHRWFLFRLLHLIDRRRAALAAAAAGEAAPGELAAALSEDDRELGALHRGYLAGQLLADLEVPEAGPLVAIDIDGVLETAWRSYSAPAQLSLLALRALVAHGFRPVLVTGRSSAEVADRCRVFRLPGAVVEYGAGIVDGDGRFESLLSQRQLDDLEDIRRRLTRIEGVEIDPAYRHSVRAFTVAGGRRRSLTAEAVNDLLGAGGGRDGIRAVGGWAQTDFIPTGVDKGTGVRALARRLGVAGSRPLRLAVGDSPPDLPMFDLAETAACPASADPVVLARPGIAIARRAYEGGLNDAVEDLIGHRPGGCGRCAPPRPAGAADRLLLALLDADGRAGAAKLVSAARAAAELY